MTYLIYRMWVLTDANFRMNKMSKALLTELVRERECLSRRMVEEDDCLQFAFSAPEVRDYRQPTVVISKQLLRANVRRFITAMPKVRPHFAVKANPDEEVLRIFLEEGVCFEVASIAEIDAMLNLGVDMETVFFSNPIKSPASIAHAAKHGLLWFCVDTPEEVSKIAAIKLDAKLYVRIAVSNEGSNWPLSRKFGASPSAVELIIETAIRLGMQICGVTFHVGSQCTNTNNWVEGVAAANTLIFKLIEHDFVPELLNIGGGYPVQITGEEPSIEEIGDSIKEQLDALPDNILVMAEPGRYLVGSAGCLVSQVVGVASRDDGRWVYLDSGIYGGLMELIDDFPLNIISERVGELAPCTMAGPTCDAMDEMGRRWLPANTQVEDLIYMPNMGAYCASCTTYFNGFPPPVIQMVE